MFMLSDDDTGGGGGSGRPSLTMTGEAYGVSASGFGTQLTGGKGQAALVLPASTPFTLEAFLTPSQVSSFSIPLALSDGTAYAAFCVDGDPRVAFPGGTIYGVPMAVGQRYHVVFEHDGGNLILMMGGSITGYAAAPMLTNPTVYLAAAGSASGFDGSAGNGSLDEVRFSTGVRYSPSGYTAPSGPLAADADTLGLWHLDGSGVSA